LEKIFDLGDFSSAKPIGNHLTPNDCFNLRVAVCYPCGKISSFPKWMRGFLLELVQQGGTEPVKIERNSGTA
jgi:hypothetical protein